MRSPPLCRYLDEERDLGVAFYVADGQRCLLSETRSSKTALGSVRYRSVEFQTGGRMTNRFPGIKGASAALPQNAGANGKS